MARIGARSVGSLAPRISQLHRGGPFGPGHASFLPSPYNDGRIFCVYHGTEKEGEGWNNRKARVMNLGTECFAPNASPICCAYQGGFPGVGPVGGNTRNKVEDTIGKIVDKAPTQVRGQLQGMFGKAKTFF